jgi:hypothetical protein
MSSGTFSPCDASEKMACLVRHLLLNGVAASRRNLDAALASGKPKSTPQDIESKKISGVLKRPQVCGFLSRQDKGENGKELNRPA